MILKIGGFDFEITADYIETVGGLPNGGDRSPHNRFWVEVKNRETGKRIGFNFYDSYVNYEKGKKELSDEDLVYAFFCLLSDAEAGQMDFEEFSKTFFLDGECGRAYKTWKECEKQYERCKMLGLDINTIYDLMAILESNYNL